MMLPENILKRMIPEDRAKLPAGTARLSSEVSAEVEAKSEKELQSQIAQYLTVKGIEFSCPLFGKKTRIKKGWPDFTLAVPRASGHAVPLAIEAKGPKTPIADEQKALHARLRAGGWHVAVVRSLAEVKAIVDSLSNTSK